jgi:hypothetical protein
MMEAASDPTLIAHLDALDRLLAQARHSPIARDRVRLSRTDFDFLLATIGVQGVTRLPLLESIATRTVTFSDHANLPIDGLASLIRIARETVGTVSIEEAIERG